MPGKKMMFSIYNQYVRQFFCFSVETFKADVTPT